jgi:pantoate kinase
MSIVEVSPVEEKVSDIKVEIVHTLTDVQKSVVKVVYDKVKESSDLILQHPTLDNALKITQMIASIIKLLESLKVQDAALAGKDKKLIALEVGKLLIKDCIKEEEKQTVLLMIYDSMAEALLETMIDVSQHLNVKVKEMTGMCCDGLMSLFKKN